MNRKIGMIGAGTAGVAPAAAGDFLSIYEEKKQGGVRQVIGALALRLGGK